jgi:hypothetical protein
MGLGCGLEAGLRLLLVAASTIPPLVLVAAPPLAVAIGSACLPPPQLLPLLLCFAVGCSTQLDKLPQNLLLASNGWRERLLLCLCRASSPSSPPAALLDQEQWVQVEVPLQFQELVEELEQQGAAAALSAAQTSAQTSAAAAAGAGAGAAAAAAHPHPRRHTAAPVLGGGHVNGVSGGGSGGAANGSAGAWPADALPVAAAAAGGGGGADSERTAVPRKFTITPHDGPSQPGTAAAPGAAAAAPSSSSATAAAGAAVEQAARAPFAPVLVVAGQGYHVVNTQLLLLSMLREYRRFHAAMPAFAAEVAQRVLELLKVFNSRTCQLVLGAGAMQVGAA